MRRFKSARQLQRFLIMDDHGANLFDRCRYNVSNTQKRTNRYQAFAAWEGVSCANTVGIQSE